jgi:hypothetical protein
MAFLLIIKVIPLVFLLQPGIVPSMVCIRQADNRVPSQGCPCLRLYNKILGAVNYKKAHILLTGVFAEIKDF